VVGWFAMDKISLSRLAQVMAFLIIDAIARFDSFRSPTLAHSGIAMS
jgi:hypothetical protein